MNRKLARRSSLYRHCRLNLEHLEERNVLTTPGTWSALVNLPPAASGGIGTMELLSDGTVMAQGGGVSKNWYNLKPDANGSYVNGSWSTLSSMSLERLYTAGNVLPDGRVFILGGEYSGPAGNATWTNTGEIYNPLTNSWSNVPNFPRSQFGDDSSILLPDGRILCSYLSGPQTYIYNPTTNSWSNGPTKLDGDASDEETWVKLPDDSILTYNIFSNVNHAQRMDPSTMTWIDSGTVPVQLWTNSGAETGGGVLLPDGRVFFIGATPTTALYTPSATVGGPGTWAVGPTIPGGYGANDAPCCMMPNGHVLMVVGPTPGFNSPSKIYEYDPTAPLATALTDVTPTNPNLASTLAFTTRFLMLPNGQVLFTTANRQLYTYTPVGSPQNSWRPAISNIAYNSGVTYTLTGTQINGISAGASYGDDAEMDTNYPIVKLTNAAGKVYYARTFNWSSTGVATGNKPVTTQFTLPAQLPFGTYSLSVIGSGIESPGVPFTTVPLQPSAVADVYTTNEDTALVRAALTGVISNDSDPFSLPLTATLVSNVSHGTLLFNANGSFSYTPNPNSNNVNNPGADQFSYKVNNGYLDSATVTVTLNVTPVNDAPVANNDGVLPVGVANYVVHPGQTLNIAAALGVLANDSDVEITLGEGGPALTAVRTSSPSKGVLNTFNADGSFSYTASLTGKGNDVFQYMAFDGQLNSNLATVNIHINNVAIANNDQAVTKVGTAISGSVLGNDFDLDLDPLTTILVSNVTNGVLVFDSKGNYTYTPNAGFYGIETFTYKVNDGWEDGTTATVSIRVDRLPVANPDSFSVKQNSSLEIFSPGLLANDSDADTFLFGDQLAAQIATPTSHGTITVAPNGYIQYTPTPGYFGTDTFTYQVSDGFFPGNTAQVTISVRPVPIGVADSYTIYNSNSPFTSPYSVLVNDSSQNGPLMARLAGSPTNGSINFNPNGTFVYTPLNGYTGIDSFSYIANDGVFDSEVTNVTLIVLQVNTAPVAVNDAYSVAANVSTTINARGVLTNDYDPDGNSNSLLTDLVTGPANGSLLLYPDGSFTYTPLLSFNGIDSFTYRASDSQALSNIATVTLTVGTPPPPPTDPTRRIVVGQVNGSSLKVFAGENGATLYTITPYGTAFTAGIRVATGDVNNDGIPDIITAPGPQTGTGSGLPVLVFNGKTGAALGSPIFPFGTTYRSGIELAAGDLNRDGYADLVFGADAVTASPQVKSFNGKTSTAFSGWYAGFSPYTGTAFGGVRVALGDVTGDGVPEIIASPGAGAATVKVYDTTGFNITTGLIKTLTPYSFTPAGGVFVTAGDLNNDGKAEIITTGVSGTQAQVRIYDIFNNTTRSLNLTGASATPATVAVGDINGDGKLDLVVGLVATGQTSRARVYDATTLTELFGSTLFNYTGYSGGLFTAALSKKS